MAEWLVWIKDLRSVKLEVRGVRLQLEDTLAAHRIGLIGEPCVIVPPDRHPGEWCLRVRYDFQDSPYQPAVRVCRLRNFQVLVCQRAPAPTKLRRLPKEAS